MIIENFEGKKNQFVFGEENRVIFQSYKSVVVVIENGEVLFGKNWNYSTTTSKYVYKFLDKFIYLINKEIKQDIVKALESNNKKAKFEKLINNGVILYDVNL